MCAELVKRFIESLRITEDGSLVSDGKRFSFTVPAFLVSSLKLIPEERVGRAVVEPIYRKCYSDYGAELAQENKELSLKETVELLLNSFTCYGWGRGELLHCDEEKLEVSFRVYASVYGEEYANYFKGKGGAPYPVCPYGYAVEGILNVFAERKGEKKTFSSQEVKCVAKGDEYCEFIVKEL